MLELILSPKSLVTILVLVTLMANVAATNRLLRSESSAYDPSQIRLQVLLIWLLPILGAALVLYMLGEEGRIDPPDDGWTPNSGFPMGD